MNKKDATYEVTDEDVERVITQMHISDRQRSLEEIYTISNDAVNKNKAEMKKALEEIMDWSWEFISFNND